MNMWLGDEDSSKVVFLRIKAFIPIDYNADHIKQFEIGDLLHAESWYSVSSFFSIIKPI